jgi:NADPH:quinone reductase-like Zn-dependent oxidoreductase
LTAPAPAELDVEAIATMPNAFVTAHHCLVRVAKLQRGERVLIHAGAGGVGMAAIQLALDIGAEVFTTAGNDEKRAYLRSIGAHHVLDSRSLDFSRQVLEITGGRGVDVVLNSLSGEFIAASFAATGQNGRFVEIGKIGIFTQAQVDALGKSIQYTVVDLGVAIDEEPTLIGEQLERIRELTETGRIRPLPHKTFAFDDAPAAFRFMAQARHLGRVVLRFPSGVPVQPNATYIVTGGLGGIGLQLARWFAEHGATHLVLLGRSEPSPFAQTALNDLRMSGVTVDVRAVDVTSREALGEMFADVARTMPPVRGIVHAAGVIDDGMLVQQQWDRFERVLAPKVRGTWLLHELTRDLPLDFFMLCSSVAAIFGSSGQGAYSAGNAFLDALAAYRRAHGLPALSINWGAWADVGMAARTTGGGRKLALDAVRQLDGAAYLEALERVINTTDAEAVIAGVRWTAWRGSVPSLVRDLVRTESTTATTEQSATSNTATPTLKDELERAPVASRRGIFLTFVKQEARRVMGLADTHAIDERQPLLKMGLDSLMAVELRNRLAAALGRSLPATLLFDYPSPGAIADFVLGAMTAATTGTADPTARETPDDDALLRDIAGMSDEEAERLLERELGAS